jgi:hypothetical protein
MNRENWKYRGRINLPASNVAVWRKRGVSSRRQFYRKENLVFSRASVVEAPPAAKPLVVSCQARKNPAKTLKLKCKGN